MDLGRYRYIALSGGAALGKLFGGALTAIEQVLDERDGAGSGEIWFGRLHGFAGCSAGAIGALWLLLSPTIARAHILMARMPNVGEFLLRRPDLNTLTSQFGLDDGTGLRDLVSQLLEACGMSPSITFAELRRYVAKELVVVVTNLRTSQRLHVSAETFPDVRVQDAIVASCSIPLLYAPLHLAPGVLACDGCLCENEPVVFPVEETLNWSTSSDGTASLKDGSFIAYASAIVTAISSNQSRRFAPRHTLFCTMSEVAAEAQQALLFEERDPSAARDLVYRTQLFVADQLRGGACARGAGGLAVTIARARSCGGKA